MRMAFAIGNSRGQKDEELQKKDKQTDKEHWREGENEIADEEMMRNRVDDATRLADWR